MRGQPKSHWRRGRGQTQPGSGSLVGSSRLPRLAANTYSNSNHPQRMQHLKSNISLAQTTQCLRNIRFQILEALYANTYPQ